MGKVLIIAEHDGKTIKPSTYHIAKAAQKISGGAYDAYIAGSSIGSLASELGKMDSCGSVYAADAAHLGNQLVENMAPALASLVKDKGYTHVLAPATTFGKNLMPRVAALLDVSMLSEVTAIQSADTFERPIYAGNVISTVKSLDPIKVMTVRATAFDAVSVGSGSAKTEAVPAGADKGLSRFVKQELSVSERPELTAARIVISGGRGMGSGDNFKMIERIADKLNAAIGASRAAVDAGYVPNDYQVGQTGKIVAPDLYIAVGISGAIQHLAGMKDSKIIVAINKDEDAPIFQIADYGLVGDLFQILPELEKKLDGYLG